MASKQPTFTAHPDWSEAQLKAWKRVQIALPIALGYVGSEIPVLDNHTNVMLVDEVGVLKKAKKCLETAEKAHVERLKARMGDADEMGGTEYIATFRGSKRVILKQDACKEAVQKFDDVGVHIGRLLAAIESGQIQIPENVQLQADATREDWPNGFETNDSDFYTTSAGGRSLYVEPIE
jgi:hypothetical protein